MTEDDLDRMIQSSIPKGKITQERMDLLVETVLLKLDDLPVIRPTLWGRLRAVIQNPMPGLVYAVPVIVAAWLGIVTGGMLGISAHPVDPLVSLLTVPSSLDSMVL